MPVTRIQTGREVVHPADGVVREQRRGQLVKVQPPEGGVLEGAIVEIEAVNVVVGDQSLPAQKDRNRHEGGLHPAVESAGVVE